MKKGNMVKELGLVFFGMLMLNSCWLFEDKTQPLQVEEPMNPLVAMTTADADAAKGRYKVQGATKAIITTYLTPPGIHQDSLHASAGNMQSLKYAVEATNYSHVVMSIAKMTLPLKTLIGNNNLYQVGQLYFIFRFCNLGSGNVLNFEPNKSYLVCGTSGLIPCTSVMPANTHATVMTAVNNYLANNTQPKMALDAYCMAGPAQKNEVTDIYFSKGELDDFLIEMNKKPTFNNVGISFAENIASGPKARRFEFLFAGYNGTTLIPNTYFNYSSGKP
jgi:hypothetical protein